MNLETFESSNNFPNKTIGMSTTSSSEELLLSQELNSSAEDTLQVSSPYEQEPVIGYPNLPSIPSPLELKESGASQKQVLVAVIKNYMKFNPTIPRHVLVEEMGALYPQWEPGLNKAHVASLIYITRQSGISIKRLTNAKEIYYYLEDDNNPCEFTLPKLPVTSHKEELPDEEISMEQDIECPIPDPIEKRVRARNEAEDRPKLVFYPQVGGNQGHIIVQIEIPKRGKTPKLEMTSNETYLFKTVFTSTTPNSRESLESKMVDIARSDTFEQLGGFENVFNSLNEKLLKWRICLIINDAGEVIVSDAKNSPPTLEPPDRRIVDFVRFEGRKRRKQPSHAQQRL